jgi:hypothetical protein
MSALPAERGICINPDLSKGKIINLTSQNQTIYRSNEIPTPTFLANIQCALNQTGIPDADKFSVYVHALWGLSGSYEQVAAVLGINPHEVIDHIDRVHASNELTNIYGEVVPDDISTNALRKVQGFILGKQPKLKSDHSE